MESFSLFWLVGVVDSGARGVISIIGVVGLEGCGVGAVTAGGAGDGGGVGVGWLIAVIHFSVAFFLAFLFIWFVRFGLGVIAFTRSFVAFVVVPILWFRSGILVDWLGGG